MKIIKLLLGLCLSLIFIQTNAQSDFISSNVRSIEVEPILVNIGPSDKDLDKIKVTLSVDQIHPSSNIMKVYRIQLFDKGPGRSCNNPVVKTYNFFISSQELSFNKSVTFDVYNIPFSCARCRIEPNYFEVKVTPVTFVTGNPHYLTGEESICDVHTNLPFSAGSVIEGITSPIDGSSVVYGDNRLGIYWNEEFFNNSNSVTIKVWADGSLRTNQLTTNNGYFNYTGWDGDMRVEISGGGKTDEVEFFYLID